MAKLALDIKMREYQITEAQFKCIMQYISEMETVNESASVFSNAEQWQAMNDEVLFKSPAALDIRKQTSHSRNQSSSVSKKQFKHNH